jgi:2'-5' RNA ligase
MMRLFLAVEIPPAVQEDAGKIIQEFKEKWEELPVKFVSPDKLHITLKFFGDQDTEKEKEIIETLEKIDFPSFEMRIQGAGMFTDRYKNPRVLYFQVQSPSLRELADLISEEMHKIGFTPEKRPFHGHITAARVKKRISQGKGQRFVEKAGDFEATVPVRRFVLMESELTPEGPVYKVRKEFLLK